jgi:hypothetical protein
MADKGVEHHDPSSGHSGRPREEETNESGRASNRRRVIVTSLLAAPAVMTLKARSARAAGSCHPSTDLAYCGQTRKQTPGQTQSDRARP